MIKAFILVVLSLCLVGATTSYPDQILNCISTHSYSINPTEAGGTNDFINLIDNTIGTTDGAEDDFIIAANVSVHSLRVDVNIAPTANDTWVITVNDDGSTTTVTCSITGASATTCDSGVLNAAIAAGSDMTVLVDSSTGTADPVATAQMRVSFCLSG